MHGSASAARKTRAPWFLALVISLFAALGVLAFAAARADAVPLAGSPNPLPGSTFEGGDGNQAASTVLRTDWQNVSPVNHSPDPNLNDNIFAGGNEGKENDPGNWNFGTQNGGSTPGKNNILDAYSFNDPVSTNVFLYLAFTRGDATGTTYMAFELNQRSNLWNNGKVNIPCRTTGDIIVSYQVSGNSPDVILQTWTTTTADAATGCAKTGKLTDFTAFTDNVDVQGAVNAAQIQNYLPSSFTWPSNQIPAKLFGEGALNLTTLLDDALGTPCFSFGSIWMHTRASTSDSSNLDDYVAPRPLLVRNCSASGTKFNDLDQDGVKDAGEPGLAGFRIWADYDNDGVRDAGEPFADTDASGNYTITNIQDPSGTYSLREQLSPSGGSTGGWICSAPQTTAAGGDFPCAYPGINGATTPNVTGKDFGNYKPGSVVIDKTADAASASAGDQIGFTIKVTNTGQGNANGVTVSDTLPTAAGLSWSESPDDAACAIAAGTLTCNFGTIAPGASKSVHISSPTTAATCGIVNNTATVTSSGAGSGSDSDSVDVNCAAIDVEKTADAASVSAGDQVGFTVTLKNTGEGQAKGVQFTDVLPAGLSWSISPASAGWSIAGGNLVFSPTTLNAGAETSVHVVATTDKDDCGQLDNTATVTTTNDGSDQDSASIDVNCAAIDVEKTADAASVSAGEQIGFTVTLKNTGEGQAKGVMFTDVLPSGMSWSISPASAGWSIAGQNLVFSPTTLNAGAETSVHVVATTDKGDCGTVDNTASVTTTNDGSDSDSASVDVRCAAIDVDKTADADSVSAGEQIGFTVTLRNTGAGEAKGVQFTDVLPSGFAWSISPAATGWSIAGGNLVFAPTTMAPGAVTTVHVVATTDKEDCGQVDNTATVTTTNDGSDSDGASVDVNCAAIDVEKTADQASVSAGDQIGFTVTLKNTGEGQAKGVTFTDVLPSGLTWSISPASAGWSIAGGNLVFAPTTLNAGAETSVHVVATTDKGDCGEVSNTASVGTSNDGSDSDSATVDVNCAAIDVDKTADAASVSAGEQIGFTVTLRNTGAGEAKGVTFTDVLPAGLSWSISPASAGWSIAGGNLVFAPTTMAAGAVTTVHVVATTDKDDCGQVDNTASVTTTNDGSDSDGASVDVNCAAIDVEKTADQASVSAGDQIGFTVTLKNTGEGQAKGVTFTDVLPSGLVWSISPASAGWSIQGQNLVFSPTTLNAGAETSVHVVATTDKGDCGTVDNTASVSTSNDGSDSDSASVDVKCAAIDVDKTADAASVSAGEQIGFTVTLRNTGAGEAKGVQFTDVLPAGLSWSIAPASTGWSIANGNLVYSPATLAAGAFTTVHVVATTDKDDCGQVDNTASVTTTNDGSDSDGASVDVNCAAIDVEKVADDDQVSAGDQIGFTVTLKNTGEGQAKGVTFTDVLPSGLTWSISPASAGWSIQGQNLVFAPSTLAAGAETSVHVVATTDAGDCGDISNTAAVSTSNDGSDSDTAIVDVNCGAIDVDKTADADSVSAGEQIGFTVTLKNTGDGEARGLQFTDALPAGLSWSISPASAGWSIAGGNLVYSPTTLAAGATTTVHVVASTDKEDCGQVDNTASVTTTNAGSDSDGASVDVNCAAVDVEKVADDDSVSAGEQIGFTVTLKNTGEGEAKGVTFTDALPAGLAWTISPASAGWSISGGNLVYAPTTLAAGAETSVHVIATTDKEDCGEVSNTAAVSTSNDGSDSDTATVDVLCAAIDVDKTADAGSVSAGEQIGFTVTLANKGAGEAKGVQFTDVLPAGFDWSISPAVEGWSIVDGKLVFAPSTLAAGATTTVHVVATTDKDDCGQIDNTASVTTTNDGSDSEDASVDVNCAAIDVEKTADQASVSAGEQIGFTVTLKNTGEGEAKGVSFTDVLPAGLTWTISPASAGWSIADGKLVFSPATMAAGAETSVHVIATTDKEDCGIVSNTASVTTSNDGSDSDTATAEVLCAAIDVDKVADAESVTAGDQIGFTVTLKNIGKGQATGVEFTDVLPAGFAWAIAPESAGWSIVDGKLVFAPSTMAAGAVTSVHVVAPTDKEDCGRVTNTASVTTANDGSDTDGATVDVLCGSVDLEKLADADSVTAGDDIGFTLEATNKGAGQARGVTITDTLPAKPGLAWIVDQQDQGVTCSIAAGELTCDLGSVNAGASKSVHISSPTTAVSCGTVDNTASVTTSNDGSDVAQDSLEILCGDIELTKTADADSVNAGKAIGFTLKAENVGDAEARNVKLTDVLPAKPGLSWSVSPAVQGCTIAGGTLTCELGTIAAGASKSVHLTSPTTAESCGRVDNTGSVTTSNADSDEASDATFVDCPAIGVEKSGPATVYHGDQATFTFKVTNPGNVPLTAITVADDKCAPVTGPVAKSGGNQDAALDPGEAWSYTCTKTIEPHQAGEANPVVNTVTATGTDRHGDKHTAKDTHSTRILHPAIDIEKTGPATATVGDVLDYTLVIANPGDVPFPAQNVVVTDPKCTQPPVLQTKGADATPNTFDPGDSWTYSCSAETAGLQPGTFVNRATVTGTDGNGRRVSDVDDFPTDLAAQAVIPGKVVKGTARLSGPSGCVKKPFDATVRGRRIAKVTFYVDGRKAATRNAKPGQRAFKYKVRPGGLGRGVHRVTARVQFVAASETKSRTLRLSFQRCARQVVTPRFTG